MSTRPSSRAEVRRLNLENDDLRRAIRVMQDRLADMVQCLFCEILEESTSRPTDFEDSMRKLSVVKRRGSALLREQRAQIECLEPGLGERLGGCCRWSRRPRIGPLSLGTDHLWDDIAKLKVENDALRRDNHALRLWRCRLDCCFTMGDVADLTGSHCPHDNPCQRCSYERRIEALEKELAPNLEELEDGVPSRWRILEWTKSQQVADDVSALFRYSGEPAPEVAKLLTKLARLNDDLCHDRPPSWRPE